MHRKTKIHHDYEVIVVGAGAAGIGCGIVLADLNVPNVLIVDREEIGASFLKWPAEMRFISPSFPSNSFGLIDLNAVALQTSPAYSLDAEHPTGAAYARYLKTVAGHFGLPIRTGISVERLEPLGDREGLRVQTSIGTLTSRFVVWAAGEFQHPRLDPFPGSEHCIHNSRVTTWTAFHNDDYIVIGGSESGIDTAVQLCALGKRVQVLERQAEPDGVDNDPSAGLSPYTWERLAHARATGRLSVTYGVDVTQVQPCASDTYLVLSSGDVYLSRNKPFLATGFHSSMHQIKERFEWKDGRAVLTESDESTITPGLFACGPSVRHLNTIFCYIYKFRQRFAVVGGAIAKRLKLDLSPLEAYDAAGMLLSDLSCCEEECAC